MAVENNTTNYKAPIIGAATGAMVGAGAGVAISSTTKKMKNMLKANAAVDNFVHQTLLNQNAKNGDLIVPYQTAVKEGKLKKFFKSETGKKLTKAMDELKEKMKDDETLKSLTEKAQEAAKTFKKSKVKIVAGIAAAGLAAGAVIGYVVNKNNQNKESNTCSYTQG